MRKCARMVATYHYQYVLHKYYYLLLDGTTIPSRLFWFSGEAPFMLKNYLTSFRGLFFARRHRTSFGQFQVTSMIVGFSCITAPYTALQCMMNTKPGLDGTLVSVS